MDGITTRELYDAIQQLHTRMAVLCQKVDRLGDAQQRKADDHEQRIRSLESARWPLPTVAVLVSMITLVMMLLGRLNVV